MSRPDYLKQIESRIISAAKDTVFITSDFLDIADTQAVNKALSRLAEDKKIRRIIRGVYDLPHYSELLQEYISPKMENVAKAIARNFGWIVIPCGDTALNMLGLSTQIPAVWMYVSSGPYRKYEIGNRTLQFKHASSKDIVGLSYKSALVVQALKALGQVNVDQQIKKKLRMILTVSERIALLSETQYGTAWIYEVVREICTQEEIV